MKVEGFEVDGVYEVMDAAEEYVVSELVDGAAGVGDECSPRSCGGSEEWC